MSHDIEAAYAAAEVANLLSADPASCFATPPTVANLSAYATKEGRHQWPHADGVIALAVAGTGAGAGAIRRYNVALEFKRPNEGTHGLLTALGQTHAYIRKGYAGAVIVIPDGYPGLPHAGDYVREVLDLTSQATGIGVFSYSPPDMAAVSPFAGRLHLHRPLVVDTPGVAPATQINRTETQWAHVREGSTEPDAFFRYLQAVKLLSGGDYAPDDPQIPAQLAAAVEANQPGAEPLKYFSNTVGDSLPERAWRHFWFGYVLHDDAILGWERDAAGAYHPNPTASLIQRSDGAGRKLFYVGRSDSIKNVLASELSAGTKTEADAARALVKKYRERAHSYREDIDSGCQHFGFVDDEGRLTDSGYRFVDACERFGSGNATLPRALFLDGLLGEGGFGALLHYIYRLSEARFAVDPLAFTVQNAAGAPVFQRPAYLAWLENELATSLKVLRKVSSRGGTPRKPLQAELSLLRNLGIVQPGFRVGVGVPINWPALQDAMSSLVVH